MSNRIKKNFFLIIFSCSILAFNSDIEATSCWNKVDSTVGNEAFALNTQSSGTQSDSLSTYDKPAIKVKIKRCEMFSKKTYTLILHPGDAKTPSSDPAVYTYYGQISTTKEVCKNKCEYAKACCNAVSGCNIDPPSCCTSNNGCDITPNCDPQITSITLNMCNISSTNEDEQKSVGICAYKSEQTGYEQAVYSTLDAFYSVFTDPIALFNPAVATDDFFKCINDPSAKGCSDPTTPSGFNLLDCFPVPIAALPPPFCKEKMQQYSDVRVFRICEEGETPVRTKSGNSIECVKPLNNMKSTFMHPCFRVTYDNPSSNKKNSNSNYPNYYTTDGDEMLYTSTEIAKDKNGEDTKIRYAKLYDDVNNFSMITSPPLELFGFNDAAYVDICGNINEDGTITTLSPNSFIDQFNQTRTFILTLPCDTSSDSEEDSCSTPEDRFRQTQICVSEQRDDREVIQDCIIRPEMEKPKVSFCNNSFNDKTGACMQVTTATSSATTANYKFQGPMNQCTDVPQPAEQPSMQLCTLNSQTTNPFGFKAIITNRCYVNLILAQQESSTGKTSYSNMCYKNDDSCSIPTKQGCKNCDIDEYCFTPYTSDNQNQKINATVTGAERLCLFGYTSSYTSLSPQWCQDSEEPQGCNRICALPQSDTTTALIDVTNRKIPSPNTQPPITSSCPYPIDNTSSAVYRTRNPIEEELCVDVYTIEFNKECKPSKKGTPFPIELCNRVKSFCSIIKDGTSNHYKNFDSCQAAFKDCLANPNSMARKSLGGTINYTCKRLSKIIKT